MICIGPRSFLRSSPILQTRPARTALALRRPNKAREFKRWAHGTAQMESSVLPQILSIVLTAQLRRFSGDCVGFD
jgi:hypothetical protein